jgi:cytosine deaminase
LKDFQIQVGSPANLVVLNQPNLIEALRFHEAPIYTISHGNLVNTEKYRQIAFG